MIAGLPKAPSKYNPVVNPERALERRNWILGTECFNLVIFLKRNIKSSCRANQFEYAQP